VLRFQLENETLRAEVEKLRTDLILSKNHFAEEINNLSEELTQNEKFVREARNEISKLTEERNIYRAYIEKLRKNKKVRKGSGPDITVLFR
jgi:chromosome segregation ATPase